MSEKKYSKGDCIRTRYGLAYIEDCNEDNTYTLRKVYGDNFIGRLTAEEIEKELEEAEEKEFREEVEEDEDD